MKYFNDKFTKAKNVIQKAKSHFAGYNYEIFLIKSLIFFVT